MVLTNAILLMLTLGGMFNCLCFIVQVWFFVWYSLFYLVFFLLVHCNHSKIIYCLIVCFYVCLCVCSWIIYAKDFHKDDCWRISSLLGADQNTQTLTIYLQSLPIRSALKKNIRNVLLLTFAPKDIVQIVRQYCSS